MWFWFKYKYRNAGSPLKAFSSMVDIWFSFRKIEWSWLRFLNAFDGTSFMWLNRKSLEWKIKCLNCEMCKKNSTERSVAQTEKRKERMNDCLTFTTEKARTIKTYTMFVSAGNSGIDFNCWRMHRTVLCWHEHFSGHPMLFTELNSEMQLNAISTVDIFIFTSCIFTLFITLFNLFLLSTSLPISWGGSFNKSLRFQQIVVCANLNHVLLGCKG